MYIPSKAAQEKARQLLNIPSDIPADARLEVVNFLLVKGHLEPLTPFEKLWLKVRNTFRRK